MNNQSYKQNIVEIDLLSLLKKAMIQWRAILVFALILGLAAGGIKYRKDIVAYRTALRLSRTETSSDDIIEHSHLSVDDQDAVQLAVSQKKQIESQSAYLADSYYMNLDPMNLKQLSLLYFIRADKGSDASDLLTLYKEMLLSDKAVKRIQKASGLNTSPKYIRELIDVSDAKSSERKTNDAVPSTDMMKVTFYLPAKADASTIENSIEDLISSYDTKDLGTSSGSIKRVSADTNTVSDLDMQTTQTNYTSDLNNLKSAYQTATDAFSDEQKTLFEKLLRENNLYDKTTSTRLKESSERQKKEKEESGKENDDSSKEEGKAVRIQVPSFSEKFFAIGFLLGVLLYVFALAIFGMMGSRCSSIATSCAISHLGTLIDAAKKRGSFLFCDRFLMKALYKNEADIDDMTERILTMAMMNSSRDQISEAELWTVGFSAESTPVIDTLVHAASERGIHLSLRSTQDGKPDNMLRFITPEKSVILAVADGTSRKKDLSLLSEMLITRKADYLGMVEIVRG